MNEIFERATAGNVDGRLMNVHSALETYLCEFEDRKRFSRLFSENTSEHRVDLRVEARVAESEQERTQKCN